MQDYKIIVIGASAGGVEALKTLFRGLKADLNAAVFVVLHLSPDWKSYLPEILTLQGSLPAQHARDAIPFEPGNAYIAPPNNHLVLQDGLMRLNFGPKVNHARPAIDLLFESAAKNYGPDVIGVILSGMLSDGSKGLMRVKQAGGTAVVQDPAGALYPDMPESALQYIQADYLLPISDIAALLNKITQDPVLEKGETQVKKSLPDFSEDEVKLIREEIKAFEQGDKTNHRSVVTCPECGGVLWEIKDGNLMRYRCHTGHVYDPETLLSGYDKEYERVFWMAIRMMVEKAAISNRLAVHAKEHRSQDREAYFLSVAKQAEAAAERIRAAWLDGRAQSSKDESAGEQANDEVSESAE